MTTTFEEQLAKIKRQASVLENLDERAVELGVILPLLKQLGWDTEDLKQIYPQKPVPDASASKVDYDLRVNGASRVFIEVKRWRHILNDEDEDQLRGYCVEGKPSLATLTNGHQWRLYLPPSQRRPIRQFLVFNITDEPDQVETNFRQFLARDKMLTASTVKKTVEDARARFKKHETNAAVMKDLAGAWNELANHEDALEGIVAKLAEIYRIQATTEQVKQFIRENETLVSLVSKPPKPKPPRPTSFSLQVDGETPIVKPVKLSKGWNELLLGVCLLMHSRHPDDFERKVLEIPKWFSKSEKSFKHSQPIGHTGIYARWGGRVGIKKLCDEIEAIFGYPHKSLTIEEK